MGQTLTGAAVNGTSMTKAEIIAWLQDVEKVIIDEKGPSVAVLGALNTILRLPNAAEIFDEQIKGQLKDLWVKLKSTGLQLEDPPLIFGLPKNFVEPEEDREELGVAETVEPAAKPVEKPSRKKSQAEKPVPNVEDLAH